MTAPLHAGARPALPLLPLGKRPESPSATSASASRRTTRSILAVCLVAGPCLLAASYLGLLDADPARREGSVVKAIGCAAADGLLATDADPGPAAGDAAARGSDSDRSSSSGGASPYPDYRDDPYCRDKGPLLDIIRATGVDIDHHEQRDIICSYLPNWSEVAALYGDEPRILGLETCDRYRALLRAANQTAGAPVYSMPRVGGLQNCGTTAFADTFFNNLVHNPTIHSRNPRIYNVPWRKHTPWHLRYNVTSQFHGWMENKDLVLPVIVVRDPYRWMASMCKINYNVHWARSPRHCPNLVPYPRRGNESANPVVAWMGMRWDGLPDPEVYADGLVGLWNEWNREYYETSAPRLIVRFEDTLFHAEKVFRPVAECAGVPTSHATFQRIVVSAKDEEKQKSSDMLSGLRKAGTKKGRTSQMTTEDIRFAKQRLDPVLMEAFGYVHPEDVPEGSFAADDLYNRTHYGDRHR